MGSRTLILLGACLALGGCSYGGQRAAPVDDRSVGGAPATPQQTRSPTTERIESSGVEVRPLAEPTESKAREINPAVVSLLNRSNDYERTNQHDKAAASIERALQIEPDNAWLWHRLAGVRLQQARYGEADNLAAKSNLMAGNNRRLQIDNWRLMEKARKARGDGHGAKQAAARAAALDARKY